MKKRITKRLLSAVLVVMMLATMIPFTAVSASAATLSGYTGNGSYYVTTAEDMYNLAQAFEEHPDITHVYVNGDIDLNPGFTFNEDGTYTGEGTPRVWTPFNFTGKFFRLSSRYYNYYNTIRGLYIPKEANFDYAGFFGKSGNLNTGASFINFENSYVYGNIAAGIFCGVCSESWGGFQYDNIISGENTTVESAGYAGGIVGISSTPTLNVNRNAFNKATVKGKISGGVFGKFISRCSYVLPTFQNSGNIYGSEVAGGVIGEFESDTTNSNTMNAFFNYGEVTSGNIAGGIIGIIDNGEYTINKAISAGKISSPIAGGTVGQVNGNASFSLDKVMYTDSCNVDTDAIDSTMITEFELIADVININHAVISDDDYCDYDMSSDDYSVSCRATLIPQPVKSSKSNKIIKTSYSIDADYPYTYWYMQTHAGVFDLYDTTPVTQVLGYEAEATDSISYMPVVSLSNEVTETNWSKAYVEVDLPDSNGNTGDRGVTTVKYLIKDLESYDYISDPVEDVDIYYPLYNKYVINGGDADKEAPCLTAYRIPCSIAAKEMLESVNARFYDGVNSEPVDELTFDPVAYYLADLVYDETFAPLATGFLNYGITSMKYFNYDTEILDYIDAGNMGEDTEGTITNLLSYLPSVDYVADLTGNMDCYSLTGVNENNVTNGKHLKYYGSALSLEDELVIKHYFQIAKGVTEKQIPKATGDNIVYQGVNGNMYEVDVKVNYKSVFNPTTINIDGASLTYSAVTYANKVFNSASTSDELKNVCVALCYLCQIAQYY